MMITEPKCPRCNNLLRPSFIKPAKHSNLKSGEKHFNCANFACGLMWKVKKGQVTGVFNLFQDRTVTWLKSKLGLLQRDWEVYWMKNYSNHLPLNDFMFSMERSRDPQEVKKAPPKEERNPDQNVVFE